MFWLLTRLVVLPVKAATRGFKLGLWTGRTVGVGRLALVGAGVAIGLLLAPGPGARLRASLRQRAGGGSSAPRYQPSPVPASATGGAVVIGTESAGGATTGPVDVAALIEEPLPAAPDADPAVLPPTTGPRPL